MSIEAMKQEPVAWQQELGNILCLIHRDGGHYISEHGWRKAIDDATLKVANLNSYMSVPQYEHPDPVAWLYVNADMPTNRQLEWTEARQGYAGNWFKYPLYAAPRQWVGLTNEEIEAVMQGSVEGERMLPYQFARAIEQLVRNKNEQK